MGNFLINYKTNARELAVFRLLKMMDLPRRIFSFLLKPGEAFGSSLEVCQLIAEGVSFRVDPSRKSDNSSKNR